MCLSGCVFVDTKMCTLSETRQFMSSTYYVRVKILAPTMNESVLQESVKVETTI